MWIAAVLDCEGTLTVHTPMNKARDSRNLQLYSRVEMADDNIPRRLQEICGGSFKPLRVVPNHKARPRCYWNLTANGLRWLLPQIAEHLLIKKEHAEIILRILSANHRGKPRQMSNDELFKLVWRIRELNRKGMRPDMVKTAVNIHSVRCKTRGKSGRFESTKEVICLERP